MQFHTTTDRQEWWDELDSLWNDYAETGHETAVELANLLEASNEVWQKSDSIFNTDPLSAARHRQPVRGPLRPDEEPDWSEWLTRVLGPSQALVTELFDVPVHAASNKTVTEDHLTKENGGTRRPDILLFHANHAISIEVKLGDDHYEKTGETTRLTEQYYSEYDWSHVLLLPRAKRGRLETKLGAKLGFDEDDRTILRWDDSASQNSVTVLYWEDVATGIRACLRRGESVDEYWAANAYLFCATIEQQLLGFESQPAIEHLAEPADVVDKLRPITLADTLNEQARYLSKQLGQ
jgi:hypothetical protein